MLEWKESTPYFCENCGAYCKCKICVICKSDENVRDVKPSDFEKISGILETND